MVLLFIFYHAIHTGTTIGRLLVQGHPSGLGAEKQRLRRLWSTLTWTERHQHGITGQDKCWLVVIYVQPL